MPATPVETPLDEALWEARMTSARLADLLGVNYFQVSRWRRGHSVPKPERRAEIVAALQSAGADVTVEKLWPDAEVEREKAS